MHDIIVNEIRKKIEKKAILGRIGLPQFSNTIVKKKDSLNYGENTIFHSCYYGLDGKYRNFNFAKV